MLSLLTLLLAPSPALPPPEPPALITMDGHGDHGDHDRQGRGHGDRKHDRQDERKERRHDERRDDRQDDHEDDRRWRGDERRDRREENEYWKHHREWKKHDYRDGDRRVAPPWMNSWWRPGERHYCAMVPGDPSRVYVFVGGTWVLRHVYDPRFRADVSGAFDLPVAPPPIPPPHLGLDLHVVLFN